LLPPHWTTVTAPRSYNSKGGSTQILRFAPGVYVVRFDNLAGSKRMVNITVSDEGSANDKRCGAEASTADGAAQVVVKCVDGKTGQASDTSFGIAYSARP
jgi:hypothetical protein